MTNGWPDWAGAVCDDVKIGARNNTPNAMMNGFICASVFTSYSAGETARRTAGKMPALLIYSVVMRFCQCDQANQIIPATSATPMTASNWWKYFPRPRQFSPSFMPSHASAKHQGQEPRK